MRPVSALSPGHLAAAAAFARETGIAFVPKDPRTKSTEKLRTIKESQTTQTETKQNESKQSNTKQSKNELHTPGKSQTVKSESHVQNRG